MPEESFLNLICELLELAPGTLTGEETLADLENWNSLAVIGFMALANDRYGTILTAKQFAGCRTVGDLMKIAMPS